MDRLPKSENLQSAADVIDALGGTGAFAALLDVGASAVSNYRKNGFPARLHVRLAQLCKREGLQVNEAVFGGLSAAPAKTPAPGSLGWSSRGWRAIGAVSKCRI